MFGDQNQSAVDSGATGGVLDPATVSGSAPPVDHQMTPAYPTDDPATAPAPSVAQMHQEAVATQSQQVSADPQIGSDTPLTDDNQTVPQSSSIHDNDLLAIKQDALSALSPLVGNLEQSPEEKFRTTMMLIQASDDRSLVRQAYEAAQAITDEKVRAQALLDVVNEINYFTSHQG